MCGNEASNDPAAMERDKQNMSGTPQAESTAPTVDIEAHIGSKLKALYAEVVNQPVPDRLLELLQKLEAKSGNRPEDA
jgi:hypothetical protein